MTFIFIYYIDSLRNKLDHETTLSILQCKFLQNTASIASELTSAQFTPLESLID